MTSKHICILLLALVAVGVVTAQSDDIPIENDNQFPPETPANTASDVIEGSGDGTGDEPPPAVIDATPAAVEATAGAVETTPVPQLEQIQPTNIKLQSSVLTPEEEKSCPSPCVCHYEGGTVNFVVDCSGYDLTELPSPIDPKTTTLNLQNNKLTDIPKEVSSLKNLKVLNAENNQIMALALGSVSELPELTVLKLGNNRLIEYPKDLQNSLLLTKLEELNLGGNDMRGELKPEIFSNFKSLRNLTLATSTPELLQDICNTLKDSLQFVCTESCNKNEHECGDVLPQLDVDDDLLPILPGEISLETDNADPAISSISTDDPNISTGTEDTPQQRSDSADNANSPIQFSSGIIGNTVVENPSEKVEETIAKDKQNLQSRTLDNSVPDVAVGATTAEGKSGGGGVSKSVIGMVVAGMIVVVAVITIKKNWSSIRRKFSSSPRPAERAGANANGTTLPEEVPLQDKEKSPV